MEKTDAFFSTPSSNYMSFSVAQTVKKLLPLWETWVLSLAQENPMEKGIATYFIILAWKIPWTEVPGGLQSMESQRAGHD